MVQRLTAVLSAIICSSIAIAEDASNSGSPFSVDATAAVYSAYMFRGLNLYDGMSFQPSLQPRYSLGDSGNLSGLLWFHLPADGVEDDIKFFEMDDMLAYDISLEPLTFSVGHYWYTYPNHSDHINSTNEFFASVGVQMLFNPTFTVYHDYREFDTQYYELNLTHTFEKGGEEGYNISPFASFGFASNSEKVYRDNGLEQITLGSSTSIDIAEITVKPMLAYTFGNDDLTEDKFWMGLLAVYGF